MKYMPRTKKQVVLVSTALLAFALILIATFYSVSTHAEKSNFQQNTTPSQTVKPAVKETTVDNTEAASTQPAPVSATTAEAAAEPAQSEAPTSAPDPVKTAADARLDTVCAGAEQFIKTRYTQLKDPAGNPWYATKEAALSALQKENPSYYAAYQECVSAGRTLNI